MKIFQKVDPSILGKLGFIKSSYPYIGYRTSKDEHFLKEVYPVGYDDCRKIAKLLEGDDQYTISKKDKVFVLPGNELPLKRIKEFVKSKKATITTDITKATIICGNDQIYSNASKKSYLRHLMIDGADDYLLDSQFYDRNGNDIDKMQECIKDRFGHCINDGDLKARKPIVISYDAYANASYVNGISYGTGLYYLFPITVTYLYEILSRKVKIVTQAYLNENAHSSFDLSDKESYLSVDLMLGSSDRASKNMGIEILTHAKIDMEDSNTVYHLWLLSQSYYSMVDSRGREKNVRSFINRVEWWTLYCMSITDFVKYALSQNLLTKTIFEEQLDSIIEYCEGDYHDCDFFEQVPTENVYTIKYTLKQEYKKILEDDKEICTKDTVISEAQVY
jgi:phosphopantetheine adenylyltransferase